MEKLMRQMVNISKIHFNSIPGYETKGAVFILRELQKKS